MPVLTLQPGGLLVGASAEAAPGAVVAAALPKAVELATGFLNKVGKGARLLPAGIRCSYTFL